MSGILKRKFEDVDGSSACSSLRESEDEVSSSESGDSSDSVNPSGPGRYTPTSILKREKRMRTRKVRFEKVTVYYFSRRQGFTSVPSQGGSSLGMSGHHWRVRQYSLGEFAVEQERAHRNMLRDHLKEEKLNAIKLKLTKNGTAESSEAGVLTANDIPDGDIDLDNTEVDEYFFLQPLTTKKRRALLRASGVRRIDVGEKHELRAIRLSREECGCDCGIFCDPENCACSMAGIKCQVDRMSFPCGCTKDGCSNASGRIEFNPVRVRTHFLHTIMRVELEKSREQHVSVDNGYRGDSGLPVVQGLGLSLSETPQPAEDDEDEEEDDGGSLTDESEDEEEDKTNGMRPAPGGAGGSYIHSATYYRVKSSPTEISCHSNPLESTCGPSPNPPQPQNLYANITTTPTQSSMDCVPPGVLINPETDDDHKDYSSRDVCLGLGSEDSSLADGNKISPLEHHPQVTLL